MKLPIGFTTTREATEVVGLGENSLELVATLGEFPQPDAKHTLSGFEWLSGGQTATSVIGCARLGCATRYIGAIGDDDAGRTIAGVLAREGVAGTPIVVPGVRTRFAIVLVDQTSGARTILEGRDAKLEIPNDEAAINAALVAARVLLVDATSPGAALTAATAARSRGIPVVLDVDRRGPHVDALMSHADVLICPQRFAEETAGASLGEALQRLQRAHGCAVVIATRGEEGSLALISGREVRTNGFAVEAVDTTGAGDAFRAGFVSRWLQLGPDADADTLLQYASATAALNCRKLGAQSGLPTRPEVESLLTGAPAPRSK